MRQPARRALGIAVAAMAVITVAAPAMAANPSRDGGSARTAARVDNHPGPLTQRHEARRKAAQELILSGKASPNEDGVVKLADDKYFQAALTGTGQVFTILAEFGNEGDKKLGTVAGPLHGEIPKPNRQTVDGQPSTFNPALPYDNSTHWTAKFDEAYYRDLFFGPGDSFADFYSKQSSGVYTVAGDLGNQSNVHDGWVQVPGNASVYGDNAVEDFGGAWQFIEDSGNAWYDDAIAELGSVQAVEDYLKQFDVWDRNDYDDDGIFDEPDGYIDHFQAVHAGQGEDAGGGAQGEDAIWSHRWYVNGDDYGLTGPAVNDLENGVVDNLAGGARIGESKYFFGDYTTEPENGGLGVFAHEFGHDLGLADFYDTAGGENGTAFWTLMSSGSWLGHGSAANEGIGTTPGLMGPEEKLFLGWLDYSEVNAGQSGTYTLNPSQLQVKGKDQAVKINLPEVPKTEDYTTPTSGTHAWWTG